MPNGAIGGIIQGLGQYAQEQNHMQNVAQVAANEEMASAFDKLAEVTNDPAERFRLQQLAYQARSKGAKAIPKAQQDHWQQTLQQASDTQKAEQAKQQQQQGQQIQQAQGTVAQGVTGPSRPANLPPGAVPIRAGGAAPTGNGPGAVGQTAPTGITPLIPPKGLNGGGGLPPPIAQNPTSGAPSAEGAPAAPSAPSPDAVAANPPPLGPGGISPPSPGFNTVAPTNTPPAVPVPKTRWWQSPVNTTGAEGPPLHIRSQEQQQDFLAQGAGKNAAAVAEAQRKAELEKLKGISAFNREQNEALMKRMKQEGGSGHIYSEIGATGQPSIKIDPGVLSSRPVAGKDLLDSNPGMRDRFDKPVDPLKFYDLRSFTRAGGDPEVSPTSVPPIVRVETDPTDVSKRFIVARDRLGQEIYREPYAPNAAFAPLVRTNTREQIVDMGDRKITVPITSSSSSQRMPPGGAAVAPALPAPNPPSGAPAQSAPPSGLPAAPVAPAAPRGGRVIGMKALGPSQVLPMKNSIEVASHQLWGDPDNPSLRPLSSYANLADDKGAQQRIGQALRMVLDAGGDSGAEHLGASAGPVSFSAGNLGTTLSYKLGIPQAAADEKAKALRTIFEQMKPEEVDYFNALMNAIPTVTGFRKLTSGGAFRWSQQGLERELPMIGLSGVTSAATFKKKMQALGDEPLTAIKNLERTNPGVVDPRLAVLIRGDQSMAAPGITPPAPGVPAVGTVMKGYRFKGGNPAEQSSWERVH